MTEERTKQIAKIVADIQDATAAVKAELQAEGWPDDKIEELLTSQPSET